MRYPVLVSPQKDDPLYVKTVKIIHGLESVVEMRKRPEAIQYRLNEVSNAVIKSFQTWLTEHTEANELPCFNLAPFVVKGFVHYVYLFLYSEVYPRKVCFFRVGKKHTKRIVDLLMEAGESDKLTPLDKDFKVAIEATFEFLRLHIRELKKVYITTFDAIMASLYERQNRESSRPLS